MASITYDYDGSVVVVTGAARGVGREIVRQFVETGARVVAADRDEAGLAETAAPHGDKVHVVAADISTEAGADSIIEAATTHFGRLDICVNNAAVAPHASILEEKVEVWDTVYGVNCRGTFLMTRAAGRAMIAQGEGGRIINFSSGVSKRGSGGACAYASSRAATEAFGRVAAIEFAPHDILVNTVSPGLIDTQPKPLPPSMAEGLKARVPTLPLARPGEPGEVAQLVLWLASPASSYVAGAVYEVDGGAGVGVRFHDKVVDEDIRYDWVTGRSRD
ncbi:dehydrogenase [Oceanicola granulosus HTCC2516]|uniref:Dehydrogenase n=1 Tax=Oceanicola granulosus (strain ATCC BAA-861 / DSM 15982 / KCTC 12143 / HTCC2516) TaxID=314256 RepID=Q2CEF3_OCEGH|nr:SDR family oxidoreductase [Oceanicola granulosus]EAR51044.1 dehydrogenase [Oceanicola granulosus HTCC2516]